MHCVYCPIFAVVRMNSNLQLHLLISISCSLMALCLLQKNLYPEKNKPRAAGFVLLQPIAMLNATHRLLQSAVFDNRFHWPAYKLEKPVVSTDSSVLNVDNQPNETDYQIRMLKGSDPFKTDANGNTTLLRGTTLNYSADNLLKSASPRRSD